MKKSLKKYTEKRDFTKTTEPKPQTSHHHKNPIFVVQEHHASHLHYDLRIEMAGVLKSWAVPKGPPLKSGIKRLAVLTEDHPMDYADFEGVIPKGNYGAGTVKIWDSGTFENCSIYNDQEISLAQAFDKGHISIIVHGKKLKGIYDLILFRIDKDWLLMKRKKG